MAKKQELAKKFHKWLEKVQKPLQNENETSLQNVQGENVGENIPENELPVQNENEAEDENSINVHNPENVENEISNHFIPNPNFDNNGIMKVFDNKSLTIYVQKSVHKQNKTFRLLDTLFHIKVEQKNEQSVILLKDLLEIFNEVFKYTLDHLKTFLKPEDHNVCYLVLHQNSLTNGINTG